MSAQRRLNLRIAEYVGHKRKYLSGWFLGWTFLVYLLVLVGLAAADSWMIFSVVARWFGLLILVALLIYGLVIRWLIPFLAVSRHSAISEIENNHDRIGQLLRTSDHLLRQETMDTGVLPVLAKRLVHQADKTLEGVDFNRCYDLRQAKRQLLVALGVLGVVLLLVMFSSNFSKAVRRIMMPFGAISYTEIQVDQSREHFYAAQPVMFEAEISGRAVESAELFYSCDNQQWQSVAMTAGENGLFTAEIKDPEAPLSYYVTAGDGKTRLHKLIRVFQPEIRKVTATLEYPAYIGRVAEQIEPDKIKAPEGSVVHLEFEIDRPLKQSELAIEGSQPVLTAMEGNTVVCSLTLGRGETLCHLEGSDADGLPLRKKVYAFQGSKDNPPTIILRTPREDVEVTSVEEITAAIQARDDFGLAEVGIVLRVDNEDYVIEKTEFDDAGEARFRNQINILLEEYGLDITSNVRLFAYATDRNPQCDSQSVTDLRTIDIKPFRQRFVLLKQGGAPPPPPGEPLIKLEVAIGKQRTAVAAIFKITREKLIVPDKISRLTEAEKGLADEVSRLADFIVGRVPQTVIDHLQVAVAKMQQTAQELETDHLPEGCVSSDMALSSLLRARREAIKFLRKDNKGKGEGTPCKKKKLEELAKETDRLAEEENDIERQINSLYHMQPIPGYAILQQEDTIIDGGELLSILSVHPDGTDLVLERMSQAETLMKSSGGLMKNQDKKKSQSELLASRDKLLQLSEHLRGLDEENIAQMLEMAKEKSQKASDYLKPTKPEKKIGERQSDDSKKPGESCKPCDDKKKSDKPKSGKGKGKGQGQGQGSGEGQSNGQMPRQESPMTPEQLAKIMEDTKTMQDWLDKLRKEEFSKFTGLNERLDKMHESSEMKDIEKQLQDLQDAAGKKQHSKADEIAEDLSKRFEVLAKALEREYRFVVDSKIERLAHAQAHTREVMDQLNQQQQSPNQPNANGPQANQSSDKGTPGGGGGYSQIALSLEDLTEELKQFNDAQLNELVRILSLESVQGSGQALGSVNARLRQMITEILQEQANLGRNAKVPQKYKWLVEQYLKSLSDDLGDEEIN